MYTDYATQSLLFSWFGGNNFSNQEVPLYSNGLQVARHEAMNRLTNDIYQHKAVGVVGMDVSYNMEDVEYEMNDRTYHDMVAHFVAVGTCVNKVADVESAKIAPLMVMDLSAKGRGRAAFTKLESLASRGNEDGDGDGDDDEEFS